VKRRRCETLLMRPARQCVRANLLVEIVLTLSLLVSCPSMLLLLCFSALVVDPFLFRGDVVWM
jgi:hypothetical protein